MSDEENLENVNFLLDRLWEGSQDLEREVHTFLDAGETFLAEVRRGATDLRRLQRLRQAIEKPSDRTMFYYNSQWKWVNEIRKLLTEWRSPGREYVRFVEEAVRLQETYGIDLRHIMDAYERIRTAVEAFDKFLAAAR